MIVLVIGGAASGKSALAERLCVKLCAAPLYIATMQPRGAEAHARIRRHRAMRSGKGFRTVECACGLDALALPPGARGALLEDLGNLVANEMFARGRGVAEAARAVLDGVDRLARGLDDVVLVGNDVFADGGDYPPETAAYIRCLARVQNAAAARADVVLESVCGIALPRKGEELYTRCGP